MFDEKTREKMLANVLEENGASGSEGGFYFTLTGRVICSENPLISSPLLSITLDDTTDEIECKVFNSKATIDHWLLPKDSKWISLINKYREFSKKDKEEEERIAKQKGYDQIMKYFGQD